MFVMKKYGMVKDELMYFRDLSKKLTYGYSV